MHGKKRPKQHRIDTKGLNLFRSSLPCSKSFEMVFSEEHNDYGIDGHLQICINDEHTGEFYKVQIKSKGEGKYINKGTTLSLSLDLDSAFFLIEQVQDPTALIVVDNESKRVFWYPIQTNAEAREALNKRLLETQVENPSITLHVDVKNNLLTPDNFQSFYSYLKDAKMKLTQKAILRIKTDKTLSAGVHHINEIERQILDLKGFDWKFRKGDTPTPESVFSVETADGKSIDYLPSKEYKPELAPRIKLRAKFSTRSKEEKEKFDAFRNIIQNGIGTINLDNANIDAFEVTSGLQLIEKNNKNEKIKISIGPSKKRMVVLLNNGTNELEHSVEIWMENNTFIISSIAGQTLRIHLSFKVGDLNGKFKIRINSELMTSASQQLRILNFIRNTKQLIISFVDNDGFRRKLFGGNLDTSAIVSNDQYNFAKALAEIEEKSGVPVPFPIPDDIKMEDIHNVFWVHRILTQGKITQDITLNFSLQKSPPEQVEKNKFMIITQSPPKIYLFNKPYIMPGFTQTIAGKITEMEMPKGKDQPTYKIRIKESEISIKKEA